MITLYVWSKYWILVKFEPIFYSCIFFFYVEKIYCQILKFCVDYAENPVKQSVVSDITGVAFPKTRLVECLYVEGASMSKCYYWVTGRFDNRPSVAFYSAIDRLILPGDKRWSKENERSNSFNNRKGVSLTVSDDGLCVDYQEWLLFDLLIPFSLRVFFY